MSEQPISLSVEQQFQVVSFNQQAEQMSREQAIETLKTLHQAYLVQKATYNELLKHEWNIGKHELNSSTTEGQG